MRGEPEAVCLWENVPGVLSDKGNAFGCFLGALVGESEELQPPGGKWKDAGCVYGPTRTVAWPVLDAQYFGLAQRRRRVFVVASARAGFDPALQCGCGYVFGLDLGQYGCPNCEGDEGPAVDVLAGVPAYGGHGLQGDVSQAATLTAKDTRLDIESETFLVHGVDVRNGSVTGEVSHTLQAGDHAPDPGGTPHTIERQGGTPPHSTRVRMAPGLPRRPHPHPLSRQARR